MDGIDILSVMIGVLGMLQTAQLFLLGDLRQRIYRLEDRVMRYGKE